LASYEKNSGTLVLIYSSKIHFKKKMQKKIIFDTFSFLKILQISEIGKNAHVSPLIVQKVGEL